MNPTMICIFDVKRIKAITAHFFEMYLISGSDCGKAGTVFKTIENKFEDCSMTWDNYVSLNVDNTNTIIGKHYSVASHTLKSNPNMFFFFVIAHVI